MELFYIICMLIVIILVLIGFSFMLAAQLEASEEAFEKLRDENAELRKIIIDTHDQLNDIIL